MSFGLLGKDVVGLGILNVYSDIMTKALPKTRISFGLLGKDVIGLGI